MKKLLTIFAIILTTCSFDAVQAQGFIRGGGGFGIGTTKDVFIVPAITRDPNNGKVISAKAIFGSFGEGGRFSLAGGYMITPYFGIELQLYYFLGLKQDYGSDITPDGDRYSRTGYSYQLRALPSLIVKAPTGKFQPYARMGVLIPLLGQTILEDEQYLSNPGATTYTQLNINGKFSVGFESSMGLQYNINDNLGIYFEATYTGLRIKSQDAEYTRDVTYFDNGNEVDNLPNREVITRYIEFQDELTLESNHHTGLAVTGKVPGDVGLYLDGSDLDLDKPLNVLTQTSNFNSLSFSVGVNYTFNKK